MRDGGAVPPAVTPNDHQGSRIESDAVPSPPAGGAGVISEPGRIG